MVTLPLTPIVKGSGLRRYSIRSRSSFLQPASNSRERWRYTMKCEQSPSLECAKRQFSSSCGRFYYTTLTLCVMMTQQQQVRRS